VDWGEAVISKFEVVPPHTGVNPVILVLETIWDKRAVMTELVQGTGASLGAAASAGVANPTGRIHRCWSRSPV